MSREDPLTFSVWDDILDNLALGNREDGCWVVGRSFFEYLRKRGKLAVPVVEFNLRQGKKPEEGIGLLLGWRILEQPDAPAWLRELYPLLRDAGEARLYGFYSQPSRDDMILWEGKLRRTAGADCVKIPPPGALSLGDISGRIRETPFECYLIRKNGIYYQSVLTK